MNLTRTTSLACCFSAALARTAAAQSDTARAPRSELAFALGASLTQQRDATASPFQFDGTGYQITTRFSRTAARTAFSITFDRGRRRLSPGPVSSALEDLTDDELRLSFRHAPSARPPATGLALGADIAMNRSATLHHYADPTQSVSDFAIGAVTLGPSASWGQRTAHGSWLTQFSMPLVGFVNHPYSDARNVSSPFSPRFATVTSLRGPAADISYATAVTGQIGLEYAYRLRVLHYADVQPMRSVSQTLSVGVVTRLGARTPR